MAWRAERVATFDWPARVYWEDTDAGGVVYHAQYLAFMERARSEWMRATGQGQEQLRAQGLCFVVRGMRIDFRAPARLDDLLSVSVRLVECRKASLVIAQEIRRGGHVLVAAEMRIAAVSAELFRPVPIPEPLYGQLAQYVTKDDECS